jgi:hypothetical protein
MPGDTWTTTNRTLLAELRRVRDWKSDLEMGFNFMVLENLSAAELEALLRDAIARKGLLRYTPPTTLRGTVW